MYGNVFYYTTISQIGGIETWFYYASKLYKDYDITLLYKTGNEQQLNRIRQNIRCVKWDGKSRIKCKKMFVTFDRMILDFADADEVIYVCHGDYRGLVNTGHTKALHLVEIAHDPRINRHLACSKTAQESFYAITGVMPELCYNPVSLDSPKRVLKLCIAQRMTNEKGKKRILSLIKELDKYCLLHDTDYQLDMYTNDPHTVDNPHITYKVPTPNANRFFGYYDYVISLTDAEGYCYTVVESLIRGTPVVVTPVPVFQEIGVNSKNSITLEFDCSNVAQVVDDMFTKKFKFKYTPLESTLGDFLDKTKTDYSYSLVTVRCKNVYRDMQLERTVRVGELLTLEKERAEYLKALDLVVEGE